MSRPALWSWSAVRCPETVTSEEMVRLIESVRADGDSVALRGIAGVPDPRVWAAGVGDPCVRQA